MVVIVRIVGKHFIRARKPANDLNGLNLLNALNHFI